MSPAPSPSRMPLGLYALTAGAFGIGTTEFVIMGLLMQVAADLQVSIAAAGLLISGYALGVFVGAPLLTAATSRMPRKAVLMALMIVFTLSLVAGSTQLPTVAALMQGPDVGLRVSLALALIGLVIVAIAENARIPVDNPATHLELTMVHEAMVLEYSGRHLAMIEAASALKLLLYVSLIACVFLPWKIAVFGTGPLAYAIGASAYVVKLAVAGFLLAVFETATAKMRVFRVPQFLGAALMLGLLGTLLLFVSRSL